MTAIHPGEFPCFTHPFVASYLLSTYYVPGISEPESRLGLTLMCVCGGDGGGGGGGGWQGEVQVTCTFATKNSGGGSPDVVGMSPPDPSASHGLPLFPGHWVPEAPTQTCCSKHIPGWPQLAFAGLHPPLATDRGPGRGGGFLEPACSGGRGGSCCWEGRAIGMTFPCVPPLGAAAGQPGSRDVWPTGGSSSRRKFFGT